MFESWLIWTSSGTTLAATALAAFCIDALVGDPPRLYGKVPHPVRAIGNAIAWLEGRLYRADASDNEKIRAGALIVFGLAIALFVAAWFVTLWLHTLPGGWLVEAAMASTLLASRGLYDAVARVADALSDGLSEARAAVSHIVGRDPQSLDSGGVARAAIESLMENFSDGVLAPLFWFVLLGLPGLVAYKTINTCDSMLGHRNERYLHFGRIPAKLDDLANFLPARIAGVDICLAAGLLPATSGRAAWRAMWRDAGAHRSPNAGWQEAAAAGALDLSLAGGRIYAGEVVQDAWMGAGRRDATVEDVRRALTLYIAANVVLATGLIGLHWT